MGASHQPTRFLHHHSEALTQWSPMRMDWWNFWRRWREISWQRGHEPCPVSTLALFGEVDEVDVETPGSAPFLVMTVFQTRDLSKNAGAIANHKYFHPMHIASKNLWKRELNTTNITDYEHIVAALLYYFRPLVILKWHAFSAQSPDAFKVVLEDGGAVLTFCMTSWTSMAGTTNQEETDFPKPSPWMCYEFIGWRTREGYHLGGKLVSFPISSVSIVSYLGWISFIIPSKGCSYQWSL